MWTDWNFGSASCNLDSVLWINQVDSSVPLAYENGYMYNAGNESVWINKSHPIGVNPVTKKIWRVSHSGVVESVFEKSYDFWETSGVKGYSRGIYSTKDNGFVCIMDNHLEKYDELGNLIHSKHIEGFNDLAGYVAYNIKELNDGSFLICGSANWTGIEAIPFLAKTNSEGVLELDENSN